MFTRSFAAAASAAVLAAAWMVASSPASAGEMSEKKALSTAVEILEGDPYGNTLAEVTGNIRDRRLTRRADTVCGGGSGRVWAFHVVVEHPKTNPEGRIDGWLVLDASSGDIVCANLPFLD